MRTPQKHNRHGERGNVLIIIFIAIALFAALSFAVSDMMRGGSPNSISKETAKLAADEIVDYARTVRQAVQNIRISNGCEDTQISFEKAPFDGSDAGYVNASAPSDNSCHVFNLSGGSINYFIPDTDWLDGSLSAGTLYGEWYVPDGVCIQGIGNGTGTCQSDGIDNEDIVLVLPYLKQEICVQINEKLGLSSGSAAPPTETNDAWPVTYDKFTGPFTEDKIFSGHNNAIAGCFEGDTGRVPNAGSYHFYQVIVPR